MPSQRFGNKKETGWLNLSLVRYILIIKVMAYVRNLDTTTAVTFCVSYLLFRKVLLTSGSICSNINRSLQVWEDEIFNIGTQNVTKSEGQQVGVFLWKNAWWKSYCHFATIWMTHLLYYWKLMNGKHGLVWRPVLW